MRAPTVIREKISLNVRTIAKVLRHQTSCSFVGAPRVIQGKMLSVRVVVVSFELHANTKGSFIGSNQRPMDITIPNKDMNPVMDVRVDIRRNRLMQVCKIRMQSCNIKGWVGTG